MSGGIGRGRGWLNLKSQPLKPPGPDVSVSPPIYPNNPQPTFNIPDSNKFTEDFLGLIDKIKQLSVNDDGILFNQKIKFIIESWGKECQSGAEVERSVDVLHRACLLDSDLAGKMVLLVASRTFLSQEVHEQQIRLLFVKKLQCDFEGCAKLQASNAEQFRNSVKLMGEFFNKARMANGLQFSFMAKPLLSYLEMLLESGELADLRLFTTQLYLNGNVLIREHPDVVTELVNTARMMLCSDKRHSRECKLWLLLALEVANSKFGILPADVQKFYQEQLGDHAMASFQGGQGILTVQTPQPNLLDSYQSNVNVLQVSTEQLTDLSISDPGSSANYYSSSFQSDVSQNSGTSIKDNLAHFNYNQGVKSGRPILGAGARLQKSRPQPSEIEENNWEKSQMDAATMNIWNQNKTDTGSRLKNKNKDGNWRDKENKKSSELKKEWEKKKMTPKTKKGWEHDDRFDTDYNN